MEPRPQVDPKVAAFVTKWWDDTNDVPEYTSAVAAARECHKTLFPAWFDRTDRFRGKTPQELRTRKDDRRVRIQLAYKNVLQTVAMTVPDDHEFKWVPTDMVGEIPMDPAAELLADTLKPVVKEYCEEAGFQEICQGWVQDACQYRLAVLKVVFDREYMTDTTRMHVEGKDQQDNLQRLRVLLEDLDNKIFNESSAQMKEIEMLRESLGIDAGELRVWTGLRVELVPIDSFRFDPSIRGYEQIYQASWMSQDVQMSIEELKAKYPWRQSADGKFTGIYPDDLKEQNRNTQGAGQYVAKPSQGSQEKGKGPSPNPDSKAETNRLTVREVWCRKLNKVFVLVEGIEYIVAEWVPDRCPKQWYPFRVLRLNRVTGQVYGVSDVELQADTQHRINRKRSDEEKARWLTLPRGIYNTQGIEQTEVIKLRDHNPGEWKGLNLGGAKSVKEVLEYLNFPMDVNAFDTSKDEVEMRQMSSLPAQFMGATGGGSIKYSSEMEAAMQGAAISSNARGTLIRKAVEGTYDLIAELLLQNLTEDDVKAIAGPPAFWPKMYSEAEAQKITAEIDAQVKQEVAMKMQELAMQGQQPPDAQMIQTTLATGRQAKCEQAFGWSEPITREVLFRRLRCKISVAMNAQADRAQRIASIQSIFAAIQMGAQAAASMGRSFDPGPMMKLIVPLFNGDKEIIKMFGPMMALPQPGNNGLPAPVAGQMAPQDPGAAKSPRQSENTAVAPVGKESGPA